MWGMGTYHVEAVSWLAEDSSLAKPGNVTNTDLKCGCVLLAILSYLVKRLLRKLSGSDGGRMVSGCWLFAHRLNTEILK